MQIRSSKRLYNIEVVYPDSVTRTVKVKAASREVAERKALKKAPGAVISKKS